MTDEQPTITGLVERLELDGHTTIAQRVREGQVAHLDPNQRALLDALVYGVGVLISGKRVNPLELKLIQYSASDRRDA